MTETCWFNILTLWATTAHRGIACRVSGLYLYVFKCRTTEPVIWWDHGQRALVIVVTGDRVALCDLVHQRQIVWAFTRAWHVHGLAHNVCPQHSVNYPVLRVVEGLLKLLDKLSECVTEVPLLAYVLALIKYFQSVLQYCNITFVHFLISTHQSLRLHWLPKTQIVVLVTIIIGKYFESCIVLIVTALN